MKSPVNASSAPPSGPRDLDIAGQLSQIYSHITILNEQVTETKEQLSNIISHVACFKEQLEQVQTAIEQLEQSIVSQGNWDANCASGQSSLQHPQFPYSATISQATMNLNRSTQGSLTSARRYQSVNRNNPETPKYSSRSGAPPVAVASPRFGTLAPPPSPFSPSVNPSPFIGHTKNLVASPPSYLNDPSIKTPQQVTDDLVSISNTGTFYIVTKGREPGIYTDWPKAEALVRGLRHSVYCKKFDKSDAIHVYEDAYMENRLERVLN